MKGYTFLTPGGRSFKQTTPDDQIKLIFPYSKVPYFQAKSFAPATFFGLVAMAIYASEAWIIFKQWQVEQFMEEVDNSDPFGDNA